MIPDPEAQKKYLYTTLREIQKTRRLLTNVNKTEREKMVCRAFLRCMDVNFSEAELRVGSHEPIDIAFGEAAFQITDALDKDRKRSLEYRELERKYRNARAIADVQEPWRDHGAMGFPEVLTATAKRLSEKFAKLGHQGCRGIDALVYLNMLNRFFYPPEFKPTCDLERIRSQGWRSASVLMMPSAAVLFATDEAPLFLRDRERQVLTARDPMINRLFRA